MAPWCDLSMSSPSYQRHKDFDTLCPEKLATSVRSAMRWYIPEAMEYFNHSEAGKDGWGWLNGTRIYMQVGTRELFEDEVNKTAEDMRAAGVEVRIREVSLSFYLMGSSRSAFIRSHHSFALQVMGRLRTPSSPWKFHFLQFLYSGELDFEAQRCPNQSCRMTPCLSISTPGESIILSSLHKRDIKPLCHFARYPIQIRSCVISICRE